MLSSAVFSAVFFFCSVVLNKYLLIFRYFHHCFSVVVLELCLDKATCMSLWGEKEMVQRESFADEGSGKEKASLWRAVNGFPSGSKRHQVTLLNPGSELSQAQNLQVGAKIKIHN